MNFNKGRLDFVTFVVFCGYDINCIVKKYCLFLFVLFRTVLITKKKHKTRICSLSVLTLLLINPDFFTGPKTHTNTF